MEKNFLIEYFKELQEAMMPNQAILEQLIEAKKSIIRTLDNKKKVIVIGNGGSAAMASHMSVDLTKNARVRSINFNEADLLTCFANDFGYDDVYSKAIEFYADEGDVLIAISSSGSSQNILNAVKQAKLQNFSSIMTFSGMAANNQLNQMGDNNFWVNSRAYNIIENTHQVWMLSLVDMIIGKSEYSA